MGTPFLDAFPITVVIAMFAVITLGCYEIGYRVGRWWQAREPGEQEGPTGTLVGALLGLMAFLLAVTMGMAADRFDARRGMVLAEANAIGTAYLQADYMPEAQTTQMRALLREYLPLRIATGDPSQLQANLQASRQLHAEMWAITAAVARSGHNPDLMSAFGDSVSELVSLNETRIVAAVYTRVPDTILLLLLAGSALALGMVGYSAGLAGSRSVLSALVLVVALGAVMTLVIDLDRPQEGFLRVSQQPLTDVQQWVGTPSP